MAHTQGGWNRNIKPASKNPIIFAGRNTHVAQIISSGLPDDEVEANCNLIAHADLLLGLLKDIEESFTADDSYPALRSACRTLIAKAEGR